MPHFWYLPTLGFSLWPCAVLLIVFIPVSIFHERNWRRTLAHYAEMRRAAGAPDDDWPTSDQRIILGTQPWLLMTASTLLGAFAIFALWALLQWPNVPAGFEMPINPYDIPYLISMLVAALGAIVIGLAIGVDALTSPWADVAYRIRRSMYAPEETRDRLLAEALTLDPGIAEGEGDADEEPEQIAADEPEPEAASRPAPAAAAAPEQTASERAEP